MTISADYAPNIDLGNGTTLAFAVTFPFADPADLEVTLFDIAAGADVFPAPILGGIGPYDYTVTGTPEPGTGIYPNGTVHFNTAPPANTKVVRARNTPEVQEVSLIDNARFPAKAVEGGLDHLELQIQEMDSVMGRAIVAPVSDGPVDLTLPPAEVRAETVLTFDAAGNVANPGIDSGQIQAAIDAILAGVSPAPTVSGWAKTLAAAKALYAAPVVLADGQVLIVSCRATSGDGGGGKYAYDVSDTTTPGNDGTVVVDNVGRRWKLLVSDFAKVNARAFGALGPVGASDDSPALQKALDSGIAAIDMSQGEWDLAKPLIIKNGTSRVALVGDHRIRNLIQPTAASIATAPENVNALFVIKDNNAHFSLQNLRLFSNGAAYTGVGIYCKENGGGDGLTQCLFSSLQQNLWIDFGSTNTGYLKGGMQNCVVDTLTAENMKGLFTFEANGTLDNFISKLSLNDCFDQIALQTADTYGSYLCTYRDAHVYNHNRGRLFDVKWWKSCLIDGQLFEAKAGNFGSTGIGRFVNCQDVKVLNCTAVPRTGVPPCATGFELIADTLALTGNTFLGNTTVASGLDLTYAAQKIDVVGLRIGGPGIPANTRIAAVTGTTITLTQGATANGTNVALTIYNLCRMKFSGHQIAANIGVQINGAGDYDLEFTDCDFSGCSTAALAVTAAANGVIRTRHCKFGNSAGHGVVHSVGNALAWYSSHDDFVNAGVGGPNSSRCLALGTSGTVALTRPRIGRDRGDAGASYFLEATGSGIFDLYDPEFIGTAPTGIATGTQAPRYRLGAVGVVPPVP